MTLKLPLSNHDPVQADAEMMLHVNCGTLDGAILQVDSFIEMAWDYHLRDARNNPGHWERVILRLKNLKRSHERAA